MEKRVFKTFHTAPKIREAIEDDRFTVYKGYTVEHFPVKWSYGDKEWEQDGWVILSPYTLQDNKTHLPLYCEDEDGKVINFDTFDSAREYIDTYMATKRGTIKIKHGDEIHFEVIR